MEKVVNKKYDFSNNALEEDFPEYMHSALTKWIRLAFDELDYYRERYYQKDETALKESVVNAFELRMRKTLPRDTEFFIDRFFLDKDDMLFLLEHLLRRAGNIYIDGHPLGEGLEQILELSGSAYSAIKEEDAWGLYYRVPELTKKNSKKAREKDNSLKTAWENCYGINPNYNAVVTDSINSIEGVFKDHYFPKDKKTQFGKYLGSLERGEKTLSCLGVELLDEKGKEVVPLLRNLVKYRGEHKNGTGKDATREIAIYALNVAIWFWNLHNLKKKSI